MPVARIYASLVEEAEPICADLLARGYNVEVVFPDAILPTPADLELRVERCSAEQAIARVEAGGSSSRCMFVTPSKGPQRELLLVEMTVLANGTDGRHPMAMPVAMAEIARVPKPAIPALVESPAGHGADSKLAEVVPFPVPSVETATAEIPGMEQKPLVRESDPNLGKSLIAELNAFLAHAPAVERPDGLHVRIFENVRNSVSVERARRNWEGFALAGVAASLLMLMALGWYAGPNRPPVAAAAAPPVVQSAASVALKTASLTPVVAPEKVNLPVMVAQVSRVPVRMASERFVERHRRREARVEAPQQDNLVAQDQVVRTESAAATRVLSSTFSKPAPARTAPTTTSELVRPASMRPAPIKIITDLK